MSILNCYKTFLWIPDILTLWPWPWCLTYLIKTLTLAISFEWYVLGLHYFNWLFLVTRLSHECQLIWPWPWCLTYLLKTLSLNISFEWYETRTLIFDTSIPCTIVLTLWPWPWCLIYLLKTITLTIFFEWHLLVGISFDCFLWQNLP